MKLTIWNLGMEILKEQGMKERSARSFVGKLIKDNGEQKVAHAIADMSMKDRADAAAWLSAACTRERIPLPSEKKALEDYAKRRGIPIKQTDSYPDLYRRCCEAREERITAT